jgi:GWxTD domain-containing protein
LFVLTSRPDQTARPQRCIFHRQQIPKEASVKSIRSVVLLLSVALITPAFAASPEGSKDWDHSPQGYFMTKAEQQEWTAVRTEEDAQKFIAQFLAKRGPSFAADVAARAEKADKYLTIGKMAGSKTLRGKVVILLGPPTATDISDYHDQATVHHSSPAVANAYSGGSLAGGGNEDSNEGSKTMGSANIIHNYHFTYATTPAGPLDVTISADPNSGKDRARGRDDAKRLEAAFEAAAQASIKTK